MSELPTLHCCPHPDQYLREVAARRKHGGLPPSAAQTKRKAPSKTCMQTTLSALVLVDPTPDQARLLLQLPGPQEETGAYVLKDEDMGDASFPSQRNRLRS